MQELIKRKNIKFVSVEHGGDEVENPQTRRMEASTLVFNGYAFVNKGACKVCRINEAPAEALIAEVPVIIPEDHSMEVKELEAQIATLTRELSEIKAQKPAVVTVEVPKELAALPGAMKELAESNAASNAALLKRIDALEKDGTPRTGAGATKELEALPEFYVSVDRKKGVVGGQ
jgi:molybdopterin/thiamine biosynthesis adenylyltransferase